MAELVYAAVLETVAARLGGSNPSIGTLLFYADVVELADTAVLDSVAFWHWGFESLHRY